MVTDTKHIFIVTYGRSGSTLLQTMLQSIDGYFVRGENNNALFHLYESWKAAFEGKEEHGPRANRPDGPWYGIQDVDTDAYGKALVEVFTREVIKPPADARVIGFKEIRFHRAKGDFEDFLNFIVRNFEGAKFIFNTRAAEKVANSGWWREMDREEVLKTIADRDAAYVNYAAKYPERCITMRYDSYAQDIEAFRPLFDFLGEEFDVEQVKAVMAERRGY